MSIFGTRPKSSRHAYVRRAYDIVAGGMIHQEINGKGATHALMIPSVDGFRKGGEGVLG